MAMLPEFAMDRVRSTITAAALLFVLGVCLVGCSSSKPDPDPPCDETQRQHLQIASLPGCAPLIRKSYDFDKD
jgi:predicted component of type VI protein secretion system